jgi:hypothetical protein
VRPESQSPPNAAPPVDAAAATTSRSVLRGGAWYTASYAAPRMLLWKARVMRPAPRVLGPLVRTRQLRIERSLGLTEDHLR